MKISQILVLDIHQEKGDYLIMICLFLSHLEIAQLQILVLHIEEDLLPELKGVKMVDY